MMRLDDYIDTWGICNFGDKLLNENGVFEDAINYPFKRQLHKCIGIDGDYLEVKFCGIVLKILPNIFFVVEPPDFVPFESVKYMSSKGKLEFGFVVAYRFLYKPFERMVYQLEVKGKVKSSLYENDQLESFGTTADFEKSRTELSKIVLAALIHSPEQYGIFLGEDGWVNLEDLVNGIKLRDQKWKSLRYHEVLLMVDTSKKKRHELRSIMVGEEYLNTYKWFIRAKYGHSVE